MRQERFGSYSMAATFAGIASLSRRKSTSRYIRFARPPRWREVMRPWWFRPPVLARGARRAFSGVVFVISAKSPTDPPRRPAEVGL